MGNIFSRRNAIIGWFALTVGRRALKMKAKVVPEKKRKRRPGTKSLALLIAGAAGAIFFWKTHSDDGDDADDAGFD